ncbi:MAG: VPLPA-CTERM sorting domain-containing protein [Paracoccaceae bacterium]
MNIFRKMAIAGALIVGSAITVGAATAAPVYFCKDGGGIDLVNDGCISGKSDGYTPNWDGIYTNAGGGDSKSAVETAIHGATGVTTFLSRYGKSDKNPGLFTLTGVPGTSGTWSVVSGMLIDFITVKAANSYVLFDVGGVSSGNWSTFGLLTKNGKNQPDVSHISFWTGSSTPPPVVPLPAGVILMLTAAGSFGFARKRKQKA